MLVLCLLLLAAAAGPAQAYIGPGAALTLVGSFLAVLGVVATAVGIVIYWPVHAFRSYLKKKRTQKAGPIEDSEPPGVKEHTAEETREPT